MDICIPLFYFLKGGFQMLNKIPWAVIEDMFGSTGHIATPILGDLSIDQFNEIIASPQYADTWSIAVPTQRTTELYLLAMLLKKHNYRIATTIRNGSTLPDVVNGARLRLTNTTISITIVLVTRNINTTFEELNSEENNDVLTPLTTLKTNKMNGLAIGLTQNRFHKIFVAFNKDANVLSIITNQHITYETYRKILAILPALVAPPTESAPMLTAVLKSFANPTAEETFDLLLKQYDLKLLYKEVEDDALERMLQGIQRTIVSATARRINDININIENAISNLKRYYNDLHTQQLAYNNMTEIFAEQYRSLKEFCSHNKMITSIRISTDNSTHLLVDTLVPVTNYNLDEARSVLDRADTAICKGGDRPAYKAALKEIFIEQKYLLYFATTIKINLTSLANGVDAITARSIHGTGNPHLTEYHCFGGHVSYICKALADLDLQGALVNILASLSNVNFLDSTVMSALRAILLDYASSFKVKAMSGEEYTMKTLMEKLTPTPPTNSNI